MSWENLKLVLIMVGILLVVVSIIILPVAHENKQAHDFCVSNGYEKVDKMHGEYYCLTDNNGEYNAQRIIVDGDRSIPFGKRTFKIVRMCNMGEC